jgi:RNA polymerase sigma-70 factor (ECF subfamily)
MPSIITERTGQSEMDIASELKKANTYALEKVHDLLYYPLCHFADGLLNDVPAAEDIVTEVFVVLWRKHGDFKTLQNIKAFLYISTRNACINYLKKLQRDSEMRSGLSKYLSDEYSEFALNEMIRMEEMQQVYEVIESLPCQCRRIFKLCYMEGVKNPEIAEKFNISVNTVKNHKVKALNLLRLKFVHPQ